jgi:hypothetical protein
MPNFITLKPGVKTAIFLLSKPAFYNGWAI